VSGSAARAGVDNISAAQAPAKATLPKIIIPLSPCAMAYVEATWITNLATAVDIGMNRQQGGRRNILPLFLACHGSSMARLVRIVVPGLP
jgi:hypothetical protein